MAHLVARQTIEITAASASKGSALESACRFLGISPAEVVAFGDAENDIEMFRVAGASVAMGQASAAVRSAATMVSAAGRDDGVAVALERLLDEGDAMFPTGGSVTSSASGLISGPS